MRQTRVKTGRQGKLIQKEQEQSSIKRQKVKQTGQAGKIGLRKTDKQRTEARK